MRKIILGLVAAATLVTTGVFAQDTNSKFSVEAGQLNGKGDLVFGIQTDLARNLFTGRDSLLIGVKASKENQASAKISYKSVGDRVYMTNSLGFEKFETGNKDSKTPDIFDNKGNLVAVGETIIADKSDTQAFYEVAIGTDLIKEYGFGNGMEFGYKIGTEKHEVFTKYESNEIFDNTTMSLTLARNFSSDNDSTTALVGVNYKF